MNYELRLIHQVAKAIPRLFSARGIDVSAEPIKSNESVRPDLRYRLSLDRNEFRLAVEVKGRWSQSVLDHVSERSQRDENEVWILVLPMLSSAVRSKLRERKVNHADLSGVLYLNAPGIRIDVDREPGSRHIPLARLPREVNPFSKKASLVLRHLFAAPEAHMRVSELAARSGLAAGWASEVAESLVQRGYAESSAEGVRLIDPASALRDWAAAYSWKKNPQRVYAVPFAYEEIPDRLRLAFGKRKVEWALTILAGAQQRIGHVRYSAVMHVYARAESAEELALALHEIHAEETDGDGGLAVLDPYYGHAAFFGSDKFGGHPVVSDVQLFLDLAHFPVRGPEAAEVLVRRRLAPALHLSAEDVHRLLSDIA
jgi:hypothetical protein